jgi:hypothetical protein
MEILVMMARDAASCDWIRGAMWIDARRAECGC